MQELYDLVNHTFDTKQKTQVPNYISFKAPLLGDGVLGCYAPNSDISILYLSCKPSEDFSWNYNRSWNRDDSFFFNYFLKAPQGLKAVSGDKKRSKELTDNTLLVDGTQSANQTLIMVKGKLVELFQLSLSVHLYESILEKSIAGFSEEVKDYCYRKSDQDVVGLTLPIELREKLCVREIINCPFPAKIQSQYTSVKTNELLIYYFQRMINGGVLDEIKNNSLSAAERYDLILVKKYLENHNKDLLDYDSLYKISNMKLDKLNRLFQEVFGHSISKYYRTQKMLSAYHMLLDFENQKNVVEVAFELGFSSVSSFSRAFYQEFNIRPSELKMANIEL